MANTTFEEIYSIFLNKIQDYKQRNLFIHDEKVAINLCQSYLINAISKFKNCKKDILHPNIELGEFNFELDIVEKEILSGLMVEAWINRVVLDITQMNLTLNDLDFKHFAEAQNLKEKSELRDKIREINSQDMWNYGFDNVPWNDWASGNYAL